MKREFDRVYKRVMGESKSSDPDNAYVFDVDGTTWSTNSVVRVLDPVTGEVVRSLNPEEYNDFKNDRSNRSWEYKYDYSDFDKFDDSSDPQPIEYTFKIMRNIFARSRKKNLYVLTARRSNIKSDLLSKFAEHGVVLKPENVFCVGDVAARNLGADIAHEKARVLRTIRARHSGEIQYFEDDEENIRIAKAIVIDGRRIKTRKINGYLR